DELLTGHAQRLELRLAAWQLGTDGVPEALLRTLRAQRDEGEQLARDIHLSEPAPNRPRRVAVEPDDRTRLGTALEGEKVLAGHPRRIDRVRARCDSTRGDGDRDDGPPRRDSTHCRSPCSAFGPGPGGTARARGRECRGSTLGARRRFPAAASAW